MKILVVIDVQNDFIDGALANEDAQAVMPAIRERVNKCREDGYKVIFTRDTHNISYLDTLEGKYLPYPHCIKFTHGWQIAKGLQKDTDFVINKERFGCSDIIQQIKSSLTARELVEDEIEEIELIGFCTDICVVSNALIMKADLSLDRTIISCDASCCAGTSKVAHTAALNIMRCCQVEVRNDY